jgi:folylpolyglutamate synthase/dihydropteroate synthase
MIFGCMGEKKPREMLDLLKPCVRRAIFTTVQNSRSEDPVKLKELMPGSRAASSLGEAMEYARQDSLPDDTVLICGSLYLIGEARHMLGL